MAAPGADHEVDQHHLQAILPSNVDQPRFRDTGEPDVQREWTAVDAIMAPLTEPLDIARSEFAWRLAELASLVLDLIDLIREGAHLLADMFPKRHSPARQDTWFSFTAKARSTSGQGGSRSPAPSFRSRRTRSERRGRGLR